MSLDTLMQAADNIQNAVKNNGLIATFDTETLGGANRFGYNELNGLTELAFTVRKLDGSNEGQVVADFSNVIGLTEDQYQMWKQELESMRDNYNLSERDNVVLNRFSKYGHPGAKFEQVNDGRASEGAIWKVTGFPGEDAEKIKSVDYALEGAKRLRDIGAAQEKAGAQDGVLYWKQQLRDAMQVMNGTHGTYKNVPIVGFNSSMFDNPMLNRIIENDPFFAGARIDIPKGQHFDALSAFRTITNKYGNNYFYQGQFDKLKKGLSSNQQEQLTRFFFGDDLYIEGIAAHTAGFDQSALARFFTQTIENTNTTVFEQLYSNLKTIQKESMGGKYLGPNKQLFMVNQTNMFDNFTRSGGMNFAWDPVSKTYKTFNGYEIGLPDGVARNGVVNKMGINQFGQKRRGLYTFGVYDLNTTPDFKKLFNIDDKTASTMNEYATGKMYMVSATPFYNKEEAMKRFGYTEGLDMPIISFVNNMEQVEGMLGNATEVGVLKGGIDPYDFNKIRGLNAWDPVSKNLAAPELQIKTIVENATGSPTVTTATPTLKDLADISLERMTEDTGARLIRDMDYTKYIKTVKALDMIEKEAGATTEQKLSSLVAKGTPLTLQFLDKLGFNDWDTGRKNIYSNSINNTIYVRNHVKSMQKLYDMASNIVQEAMPYNGPGDVPKDISIRRNMAFKDMVNDALELMSKSKQEIINGKPVKAFAEDMNYVQFKKGDLLGREQTNRSIGTAIAGASDDIINVDLNNGNGLMRLAGEEFKDLRTVGYNSHAYYNRLSRIYDNLKEMPEYRNSLDIDVKDFANRDASVLASEMASQLNKHVSAQRASNPAFGYMNKSNLMQSVSGPHTLVENYLKNNNSLDDLINVMKNRAFNGTPQVNLLGHSNEELESSVKTLVDRIMMPFTKEQYASELKYLSGVDKQTLLYNYDMLREEVSGKARDILKGVSYTDMDLGLVNDSERNLVLMRNGEHKFLNLPTIGHSRGMLYTNLDGNKYVIRPYMDTSKIQQSKQFNVDDIKYGTSFGLAKTEGKTPFSFSRSLYNEMENGGDPSNRFISALKNWKQAIRESSPAIEFSNPQMFMDQFIQDTNDLVSILPEMNDFGVIDDLQRQGLIPELEGKKFQDYAGRLLKLAPGQDRIKSFDAMTATERNAYNMAVQEPLLQYIGKYSSDERAKHFASNANMRNKDTTLVHGDVATGGWPLLPGSSYENQRPPVAQFPNSQYYRRDLVEQGLKDQGLKNVYTDLIWSDSRAKSLLTHVYDQNTGTEQLSTITSKAIQISEPIYKKVVGDSDNVFQAAAAKFGYTGSEANQAAKLLKEKAMQANLYEQEIFIDSRLHDVIFNKMRIQTVSSRKEMQIMHENNLATIESMETFNRLKLTITPDGKVVYGTGKKVNQGDLLFRTEGYTGGSTPFAAKHKGVLRGAYFDEFGDVVDEDILSRKITGIKDVKQAQKTLDSMFQFKYYVLPQEELYGNKIFQGASEKGVANPLKIALGQLDKTVASTLKGTEFESELGTIQRRDYLDKYLFPRMQEVFGASKASDLMRRIESERHAVGDIIYRDLFKGDAHVMINQDIAGHNNPILPIKSATKLLEKAGATKDELASIFPEFKISGLDNLPSDLDNSYISIDRLNQLMNQYKGTMEDTVVKDANGKAIGSYGYFEFTQVLDDLGGTYKGISRERELKKEQQNLKSNITALQDQIGKAPNDQLIGRLTQQQKALMDVNESIIGERYLHKGLQYSDRTRISLGSLTYNDDVLENMKDRLSIDEFQSATSHIMNGGELDDLYRGVSAMQPFIDRMDRIRRVGDNEVSLRDVINGDKYSYLREHFTSADGKVADISAQNAETLYSIGAGKEALRFNQESMSIDRLTNGKFHFNASTGGKPINIADVDLDIKGQADTIRLSSTNPYSNNLLIDIGEKFGANRYLAVGRTVAKQTGDSLVKEDHVSMLSQLKSQVSAFEHDMESKEETQAKMASILKLRSNIITQQQADISGKEGYAGELRKVRMYETSRGKGAGRVFYTGGDFDKWLKDDVAAKYAMLQKYNAGFLDNAMFEGKSIMKHYAENKFFDVQERSLAAFKGMGYFDEDMMERRLKNIDSARFGLDGFKYNKANKAANEAAMTKLLETHGDIMLTDRFPEIQEGSVKPSLVYLNRNLAANEARALGAGGMSMKLDYDGDTHFAARMSTSGGESYFDYVLKGGKVSEELSNLVAGEKFTLHSRAVGQNYYFERKVQNALRDDIDRAIKNGDFNNIVEKSKINGRLYSNITPGNQLSLDAIVDRSRKGEGYLAEMMNKSVGQGDADMIKYMQGKFNGNQTEVDMALGDIATHKKYKQLEVERVSKIFKTTIGEANITNFKLRKLYETAFDPKGKDYYTNWNILQGVLYQAEEGVISAKKAKGLIAPDRAEVWNKAVNNILSGRNIAENLVEAEGWINKNISDKIAGEAKLIREISPSFRRETADFAANDTELANHMIAKTKSILSSMGDNKALNLTRKTLNFGEKLTGMTGKDIDNLIMSETSNSMQSSVIRDLAEFGFINKPTVLADNKLRKSGLEEIVRGAEMIDGTEWLKAEKGTGQAIKNILKSTREKFSKMNIDGKSIAVGALGLAGAYLVAGFVGGNPSRPADTQAMEDSDQYYTDPSFQDSAAVQQSGSKQQGYVININANTRHGQRNISDAISSAIQRSVPTDVNIAMNINSNQGNITDRDIERMLAGAI
jgi:hypothetical protein